MLLEEKKRFTQDVWDWLEKSKPRVQRCEDCLKLKLYKKLHGANSFERKDKVYGISLRKKYAGSGQEFWAHQ